MVIRWLIFLTVVDLLGVVAWLNSKHERARDFPEQLPVGTIGRCVRCRESIPIGRHGLHECPKCKASHYVDLKVIERRVVVRS